MIQLLCIILNYKQLSFLQHKFNINIVIKYVLLFKCTQFKVYMNFISMICLKNIAYYKNFVENMYKTYL